MTRFAMTLAEAHDAAEVLRNRALRLRYEALCAPGEGVQQAYRSRAASLDRIADLIEAEAARDG